MEYLNAYDKDGNHIGKIEREAAHAESPGVYHKAVWVWFINSKKEVLVQKRSKDKKSSPLKWDFPSAGHVEFGEDLLATCVRETEEELGITIPKEKFEYLFRWQKGAWEFGETFLVKADIPIKDMQINPEEVEQVKWLAFDAFKKLFYSSDFCGHSIEYKNKVIAYLRGKR